MSSPTRWAVLCLLALLVQPMQAQDHILFLRLHIDQGGNVRVLASKAVPGKLKGQGHSRGRLKLELQDKDGIAVWEGQADDPRVKHFEFENPPGSGSIERRSYIMPEAEFMVRVPLQKAAARVVLFEETPVEGAVPARKTRKVLLAHPVSGPGQDP